ncbi:MAG: hypothetical protein KDD03_11800 [Gelidibacter sp.]|nr:hypothetical protein [Gelidibacter sp.]
MTKEQRDKVCITCKNHINDDRYGMLCGLTNNIANFQDSCRDYSKIAVANQTFHQPTQLFETVKPKKKKGLGSLIGTGIAVWIIFKIVLFIIKMANNS